MGLENIAKTIRKTCEDDEILQDMLIDLLNYNFKGSGKYTEEYKKIIDTYAQKYDEGDNNGY